MPRPLHTEPEADADLADAFAWYETQRPGLGSEFLAGVGRTFLAIEQVPDGHQVLRGITWRALLRRFPYGVYYILEPDLITVTAVLHARRDPIRWQARADG